MVGQSTILVIGASPELERALDSLAELELPVRIVPTPTQALHLLKTEDDPRVRTVLVDLRREPEAALCVIRRVRSVATLEAVPVAVWGADPAIIAEAYRAGATSAIRLDGSASDAIRLVAAVHYWAVENQSPQREAHPA